MYALFFGGDALALVAHVSLLSFLLLRNVFVEIVDCYEDPGQVVTVADALEPCGFGGKTSSSVEIPDCTFDSGKLIDLLDSHRRGWAGGVGVEAGEVGMHFGGGRDNVG